MQKKLSKKVPCQPLGSDDFLAVAAHGLRVPLASIIGMARLLDLEYLLPAHREQVRDIIVASEHMLALVEDILDLSSLRAGKLQLDNMVFNLSQVLEEIVTILSFQAESKGLELLIDFHSSVPALVFGAPKALRQILVNLLSNIIKITKQGYVVIHVRTLKKEKNKVEIGIDIENTNSGVDQKKLIQMFKKLNEKDEKQERRYAGTGLGITISEVYVEFMGGKIDIAKEGNAIFSCVLPFELVKDEAEEIVSKPNCEKKIWDNPDESKNKAHLLRVLLVEDDQIVQKVHRRMLERLGCRVDIAEHGSLGFEMYQKALDEKQPYVLIFMDIALPGMSGLEVVKMIRDQEAKTAYRTPIIAMTGYAYEADQQNCFAVGMDAVAIKPVQFPKLEELLQKWGRCVRK